MKKEMATFRFWLRIVLITLALVALVAICLLLFSGDLSSMFRALSVEGDSYETLFIILLVLNILLLIGGIIGLYFLQKHTKNTRFAVSSRPRWNVRELVVGSLCIGLSFILSLIALFRLPNGGIISPASMLPILLFSYIYGTPKGAIVCVAYGLLEMIADPFIVSIPQVLLDYVFAFGSLSLAGLFKKSILPGITVGSFARLIFHFLSGILFFSQFAPEGVNLLLYSFLYQCSYILPEMILCILISLIPGIRRAIETLRTSSFPRN